MPDGPSPKPYPRWTGLLVALLCPALIGAAVLAGPLVPLPRRADRQVISLALMMGSLLLATLAILVYAALVTRRNAAVADAALAALGLAGERYLLRGRRYHGAFAGRRVDAYFAPARRYTPPSLEIYLGARARTRLGLGPRRFAGALVRRFAGTPEIPLSDPSFSHLSAHAADPAWARALLRHPSARDALLRLATDPSGASLHLPCIEPDAVVLRISGPFLHTLSPAAVRRWAGDLAAIATAAEHLPPPAEALEASAFERAARSGRGSIAVVVALAVVAILVVASMALILSLSMGIAGRR